MTQVRREEVLKGILTLPALDAHTHVDARHLTARGLHDVLLYHMIVSELYSGGCPDGERLSEEPDEAEISYRMERALPYLPHIQNTSCFHICKTILKDLYGWEAPITSDNWHTLHSIIRERAKDPQWPREILRRANIRSLSTELWRRGDGSADDILQYALEWAFFARCQWGQFDTALLELEVTWDKCETGAPLPVTITEAPKVSRPIRTVQDAADAMRHYVELIPFGEILAVPQSLSTDIRYRIVSDEEMQAALDRRGNAGIQERDTYSSYLLELFLVEVERRNNGGVVQFAVGAEPLPYESGSKLRGDTLFDLAAIVSRHKNLKFQVFLANASQNQALCTLVRELPNLYAFGYWWHNFYPGFIAQVMEERLDMIPINKQVGFFTDAYCLDWAYGKAMFIRGVMADVMTRRVNAGRYTLSQALDFCRSLLTDVACDTLGMR
ncbi:MAG: hypothetical protein FWF86_06300 [Clostridia bacterium]|nr:hypothetical protein [Clostridia bacterium]